MLPRIFLEKVSTDDGGRAQGRQGGKSITFFSNSQKIGVTKNLFPPPARPRTSRALPDKGEWAVDCWGGRELMNEFGRSGPLRQWDMCTVCVCVYFSFFYNTLLLLVLSFSILIDVGKRGQKQTHKHTSYYACASPASGIAFAHRRKSKSSVPFCLRTTNVRFGLGCLVLKVAKLRSGSGLGAFECHTCVWCLCYADGMNE